jgi:hypothetical protein
MSSDSYVPQADAGAPALPPARSLLHPGERWRFWLAALASAAALVVLLYVLGHRGLPTLIVAVISLLLAFGSVWWALQIMRARLLGNSVKVTSVSFPELQALLDEVCSQLGYKGRIDVYVAEKSEPSVKLTAYLGTRIILIEGGLIAELLDPPKQAQLRFLIARHVGALKARQYRLDPLLVMLSAADALQFVKPFLLPYYRSIAYSGDQIGLASCGSVEAALEATGRLLVGKELADRLPLGGVLPQAALVKERLLPRFAQFLAPTPHVINRYLNLLMYGRLNDPEAWERLSASLTPSEKFELDQLWMSSPHRRRARKHGLPPQVRTQPAGLNFPPPPFPATPHV